MTSECPGWVCYAEKVVGESAFPFMSKVKSPQQLCGQLLKHYLSLKYQISASRVKIVTVMPCYDKKLEAVRPNFTLGKPDETLEEDIKEVDTVLATHELVDLISSLAGKEGEAPGPESFSKIGFYQWKGEAESGIVPQEGQALEFLQVMRMFIDTASGAEKFHQIAHLNTTSNGYLEHIFRRTAKEVFGVVIDPQQPLKYVQGKNKDLKECVLELEGGKQVLRFAAAYGFRNIQNIIRNIKRGKCEYDYIEIMACPGGCLNGGGQIKPRDFGMDSKQLLEILEIQMQNLDSRDIVHNPEDNQGIQALLKIMGDVADKWHHTSFKAIPKENVVAHNIKW